MEKCHKMLTDHINWANLKGDQVRIHISSPLPLSGLPGHVTIQTQFFFNKDLDYLRYGSKGSGPALSISKMKVACYPDFGLELLIPEHMWINDVCTYDISTSYGIYHWWFNRQRFYIDRHIADSRRKVVRTHMRILSVVRIKAYYRYGKGLQNLYPSDFEDLNLLLLQGHLNHLPGSEKHMLSTAVNLWTRNLLNLAQPGWDAKGFEYKHDYTIIESSRAVVFPVSNNERKIMRFNDIYEFSDGTLTNILEALDYRVKEYKVNLLNLGMNTQFWTDKVVTRSKEFIHAIEWRLKTRRIFRNLECFVGGHNIQVIPKYHSEDGNPARANIKQALGRFQDQERYEHVGPQNTRSQDGERPQVDDQGFNLADDLKEAQDHISSTITSHKTKITTSKYNISHEESKTTS
ncbi:hypothetical protein Tco_1467367 [Tanacetum coccineum]